MHNYDLTTVAPPHRKLPTKILACGMHFYLVTVHAATVALGPAHKSFAAVTVLTNTRKPACITGRMQPGSVIFTCLADIVDIQ